MIQIMEQRKIVHELFKIKATYLLVLQQHWIIL